MYILCISPDRRSLSSDVAELMAVGWLRGGKVVGGVQEGVEKGGKEER